MKPTANLSHSHVTPANWIPLSERAATTRTRLAIALGLGMALAMSMGGCPTGDQATVTPEIFRTWSEYQSGNSGEGFLAKNTESAVAPLLKWSVNVGRVGFSSPVIGPDGTIVVANLSGELVVIEPDGSLRWRETFVLDSTITSTPAIAADGSIFFVATRRVGSEGESVLCRVSRAGFLLWTRPVVAAGRITTASPRVFGEFVILYVPAQLAVYDFDGNLVSLGDNFSCGQTICGGSPIFDSVLDKLSSFAGGLLECTLLLPVSTSECWDNIAVEFDGSVKNFFPQPDPTAVIFTHDDGGPIIVALSDRCMTGYRFNAPNLEELWQRTVYGGRCGDKPVIHGSPANLGGGLLVTTNVTGEVTAYDPLSGAELWKYETIIEQPPIQTPFGEFPQDPLPGVPFVCTPASFVRPIFVTGADSMHLLDNNGALIAKRDLIGLTQASFALSANHAYLSTSFGLFSFDFDLSSSFTIDNQAPSYRTTPAIGDDGTVYAITGSGTLRAYGSVVGTVQLSFQSVEFGQPADGASLLVGEETVFSASVLSPSSSDFNGTITFSSNIDGEMCALEGNGTNFACIGQLTTPGEHVITVRALASTGTLATDSVTVNVAEVNLPPVVAILAPIDGGTFGEAEVIAFMADVSDALETIPAANISWTSDQDGALGTGDSISLSLSLGTHVVTLSAVDSEGLTAQDSVTIEVIPGAPPTVDLVSPLSGFEFTINETIAFQASSSDPQDGALTDSSLVWTSNIDGALGNGETLSRTLSQGNHTIVVTATNSLVLTAQESSTIRVVLGPGFSSVNIVSPAHNTAFSPAQVITFVGTGTDPEDGAPPEASFKWSSNIDGDLGTGRTINTSLSGDPDPCNTRTHLIKLEITDSDGNTSTHMISIRIKIVC